MQTALKLLAFLLSITVLVWISGCGGGDGGSAGTSSEDASSVSGSSEGALGGGDDGGSSTVTGTYIDAKVAGLRYSCAGKSSTTDSSGKFTCESGSTVTFKMTDNITIGSYDLSKGMTGGEVWTQDVLGISRDNNTDAALLNITRLFLTLYNTDTNGNLVASSAKIANFDATYDGGCSNMSSSGTDCDVDAIQENYDLNDGDLTFATEAEAQAHVDKTIEDSGKTPTTGSLSISAE